MGNLRVVRRAKMGTKQVKFRRWRADYESLPVKRLRTIAAQWRCPEAKIEAARNTDAPQESLLQLLLETRWQRWEEEQSALTRQQELKEDEERLRAIEAAELQQMTVESLVKLATQRPSITAEELEQARDQPAPRAALMSLLQSQPKSVPKLFMQAASGDEAGVRHRLEHGADPNEVNTEQTISALYRAAANGHSVVVSQLLEARADPNRFGYPRAKKTPLMTAAEHGHVAVVGLLLRAGAKRTIKDKSNRTALKLAQAHRHDECEELLLPTGRSPRTNTPRRSPSPKRSSRGARNASAPKTVTDL